LTYITSAQLDTAVKSDKNVFLFAQARDKSGAAVHLLNSDDITAKKDFMVMLEQGGAKQSKYLFHARHERSLKLLATSVTLGKSRS